MALDGFPLPRGAGGRLTAGSAGALSHFAFWDIPRAFLGRKSTPTSLVPRWPWVPQVHEEPPWVLLCLQLRHGAEQEGKWAGGWAPRPSVGATPIPQPS